MASCCFLVGGGISKLSLTAGASCFYKSFFSKQLIATACFGVPRIKPMTKFPEWCRPESYHYTTSHQTLNGLPAQGGAVQFSNRVLFPSFGQTRTPPSFGRPHLRICLLWEVGPHVEEQRLHSLHSSQFPSIKTSFTQKNLFNSHTHIYNILFNI